MFKPAKLSSAMTDNTCTPEKTPKNADLQIDITLDLSSKDFLQVPQIFNFQSKETTPTIIDLRKNSLSDLPTALFQIVQLKQLRLDSNLITKLPQNLPEPNKCRLQFLSLSYNNILSLPDWFVNSRLKQKLEKLDLSYNQQLAEIPDGMCTFESLKVFLLHGNKITFLPAQMHKLNKIEEFGLEWWQYVTIDEINFNKKVELGLIRDDTVMTNRQILRQIFESFKQVNFSRSNLKPIHFSQFYLQYKKIFSIDKQLDTDNSQRLKYLFHLICHFGHIHLLDQLLQNLDQALKLNKPEQQFNGQTLLQVALHTSKSEDFMSKLLTHLSEKSDFVNFEVYLQRPNEELPLQRQCQLLHPLMIVMKKKLLRIVLQIIKLMQNDAKKSNQKELCLDIKDENRNSLLHHAFGLFQEELYNEKAKSLCNMLLLENNSIQIQFKMNEMNKQGMTPLDLAIELRIFEAVEFALQCNELKNNSSFFNTNFNQNQRGLTPLHRAVQAHNHLALQSLLKSSSCDTLIRDKDFKKARDYCCKILVMQKLLRLAELKQLTSKEKNSKKSSYPLDIIHNHFKLTPKDQKIAEKKSLIKRSASENRGNKTTTTATIIQLNNCDSNQSKRPFKIERPLPIDRLNSFAFTKTVIETITQNDDIIAGKNIVEDPKIMKPPHHHQSYSNTVGSGKTNKYTKKVDHLRKKSSQIKPFLAQPDPPINIQDKTSPGFLEDEEENSVKPLAQNILKSSQSPSENQQIQMKHIRELSNYDTFVIDDADASEESPTTLPSNQFQYVMTVNNSKLSRKSYYKTLLKNEFETQFCRMLEPSQYFQQNKGQFNFSDVSSKLQILYQVYSLGNTSPQQKIQRDSLEFFELLLDEVQDPKEAKILLPIVNEIMYLYTQLSDYLFKRDLLLSAPQDSNTSMTIKLCASDEQKVRVFQPQIINSQTAYVSRNMNTTSTVNNHEGGLIMMKTLRHSVSLKSLINSRQISINDKIISQEYEYNAIIGKDQLFQRSPRRQLTFNSMKGNTSTNQLEESKEYSKSPISPRRDSGQVPSKEQLLHEKKKNLRRQTSDLMCSPVPPTSQEYSLRSQPKRKQNIQILDASIRTVCINIDAVERDQANLDEIDLNFSIGKNLLQRHSKIVDNAPIQTPHAHVSSKILTQQIKAQTQTTSTSLHRRLNHLTKATANQNKFSSAQNNLTASRLLQKPKQFTTQTQNFRSSQLTQRSVSSSYRQSVVSVKSKNSNTNTNNKQTTSSYRSQIQCVPQSIQINLAKQEKSSHDNDDYYKGSNSAQFNMMQNPGS